METIIAATIIGGIIGLVIAFLLVIPITISDLSKTAKEQKEKDRKK